MYKFVYTCTCLKGPEFNAGHLPQSPLYFLKQGVTLKLELIQNLATLAPMMSSRTPLSPHSSTRVTHWLSLACMLRHQLSSVFVQQALYSLSCLPSLCFTVSHVQVFKMFLKERNCWYFTFLCVCFLLVNLARVLCMRNKCFSNEAIISDPFMCFERSQFVFQAGLEFLANPLPPRY